MSVWFLGSSQRTSPIFLHPSVRELCGHPASSSGAPGSSFISQACWRAPETWEVVSNHTWGCPLPFALCADAPSAGEALRVRNVHLKALHYSPVLLSLKTTVSHCLNILRHCCSYRRRADLVPVDFAGGICSRFWLRVRVVRHSLRNSGRAAVVKLLSRERRSVF